MFGQKVWRPVAVAVVVSAAGFLPQGVAVAATPGTIDTVTCSQISAELRNGSLNCSPLKHDGVDGVFIGPVSSTGSPAGGTTSGSATTSGSTGSTGSTPTTTETTTPTTTPPATDDSSGGSTGNSGSGSSGSGSSDDADSGSGSGSGSGGPTPTPTPTPTTTAPRVRAARVPTTRTTRPAARRAAARRVAVPAGSSYSTNSGVSLGAAACPAGVGGTTSTAATGSVDTGATTSGTSGTSGTSRTTTDTSGVASVTDVTGGLGNALGNTVGTVTNNVASTAGTAVSSVAGTVTNAAAAVAGNANLPADVIDLGYWYLTLPTGAEGSPETIENPNLAKFTNEFFKLNNTRDGVVFSARADGVTTKNSSYPRSELREMNGSEKASWSNTSGSHTLDVCEAITKTPSTKPEVVAAQIHDGSDDVMQIRLEGKTLMVQYNDGKTETVIDPNYVLGTPYNVRIVAEGGKVDVLYNGQKKAELPLSGSGWYWKVGAYVQSSTDKGESPDATGEVTVYSLKCVHA